MIHESNWAIQPFTFRLTVTLTSQTPIHIVGTTHKSSAALSGAPGEHLHEPTSGPFQGPDQSFRPITGQFILTNRRQHANPADRIKRGKLFTRHQFIHSVVHAHRRHIKNEKNMPDCRPRRLVDRAPQHCTTTPGTAVHHSAADHAASSSQALQQPPGRTQSLLNSTECTVRHRQTTHSPHTVASERTRRSATKILIHWSTAVVPHTQHNSSATT